MSLATRCANCNTVFRVVQDQLKVSEGWVRCGRCDAVFNALEGLFDLGREAPPPDADEPDFAPTQMPVDRVDGSLPSTRSMYIEGTVASVLPDDLPEEVHAFIPPSEDPLADPVDAHLFGPRKGSESKPKPAGPIGARDRVDFSDARFDSDLFAENMLLANGEDPDAPPSDAATMPLESSHARPDFLRRAERRARWSSGPARTALAAAGAVLMLTLGLQAAHHFRDALAAEWPALRPVLGAYCSLARCSIEPLRRIDDVQVESTALTRSPGGDAFVLSVNLKNRGTVRVAAPAIDLSLTDVTGRLVARRALSPTDFRGAEVLPAGGEATLQLTLATATAVTGYTVEIFYP